jgi:hypothetical protein
VTGLVGWWPLHENSGSTARDLSGNGNHGGLNGGVTQGVVGKGGLTAYSFDGEDDYVAAPTGLDLIEKQFTAAVWVRPYCVGDGSVNFVFGKEGDERGTFRIWKSAQDNLKGNFADSTDSYSVEFESSPVNGNWYFLVLTYDGSTLRGYKNGIEVDSKNVDANPVSNDNPPVFGANSELDKQYFEGSIADGRIYDRALSSEEIQTLYEWGSGDYTDRSYHDGSDPGAVSRWKFDGSVSDFWKDNDATLNSGASVDGDDAIRGKSAVLDAGSDENITVQPAPSNLNTHSDSTVSFWTKPTSTDLGDIILNFNGEARDGITHNRFCICVDKDQDKITAATINDKTVDNNSVKLKSGKYTVGNWHHVTATYDYSKHSLRLFINGKEYFDTNSNANFSGKDKDQITIGCLPNNVDYISMHIDDLRVYNRVLEPHEVFQLYQWGTRGRDMRKLTVNKR